MDTRDDHPDLGLGSAPPGEAPPVAAPLGGTRTEAVQRLQIGLSGLAAMILLVGLANIIQNRAQMTDAQAVPEAAPATEPVETSAQRDPLADAGVVPDLPAEAPEEEVARPPAPETAEQVDDIETP